MHFINTFLEEYRTKIKKLEKKMNILWIIMLLVFLFYLPPTYADECTEGNCTNGHGTMLYSTGHKYIGGFKDGLPNFLLITS